VEENRVIIAHDEIRMLEEAVKCENIL